MKTSALVCASHLRPVYYSDRIAQLGRFAQGLCALTKCVDGKSVPENRWTNLRIVPWIITCAPLISSPAYCSDHTRVGSGFVASDGRSTHTGPSQARQ